MAKKAPTGPDTKETLTCTVLINNPPPSPPPVPPNFPADGTVTMGFTVYGEVVNPNDPTEPPVIGDFSFLRRIDEDTTEWFLFFSNVSPGNGKILRVSSIEGDPPCSATVDPLDVSEPLPIGGKKIGPSTDTIMIRRPPNGAVIRRRRFVARGTVTDAKIKVYGVLIRPGKPPVVKPGQATQRGKRWRIEFNDILEGDGQIVRVRNIVGTELPAQVIVHVRLRKKKP
jgi:hypothetical protein